MSTSDVHIIWMATVSSADIGSKPVEDD